MTCLKVPSFPAAYGSLLYRGIGIIVAGIILFYSPFNVWMVVILGIFAIWMIASATILLARARKGRAAIPEGFSSRVIIAITLLVPGILIFLNPMGILQGLMIIVGVIAFLLGLLLLFNGIRLRNRRLVKI